MVSRNYSSFDWPIRKSGLPILSPLQLLSGSSGGEPYVVRINKRDFRYDQNVELFVQHQKLLIMKVIFNTPRTKANSSDFLWNIWWDIH